MDGMGGLRAEARAGAALVLPLMRLMSGDTVRYARHRKETSMSTHLRPSGRWIGGLALILVGLLGGLGLAPAARAAGAYSVSLRTPNLVRQFERVELRAVVKDSQGQPVNGMPVTFQVPPAWQNTTRLLPAQALTQAGTAHTVFEATMPGVVLVTVQVGNTTETTHITVTGTGSRVSNKQP